MRRAGRAPSRRSSPRIAAASRSGYQRDGLPFVTRAAPIPACVPAASTGRGSRTTSQSGAPRRKSRSNRSSRRPIVPRELAAGPDRIPRADDELCSLGPTPERAFLRPQDLPAIRRPRSRRDREPRAPRSRRPIRSYRAEPSRRLLVDVQRFDSLVTHEPPRVFDAREHIFTLEPGIPFQNGRDIVPSREHAEHVLHGEPPATNDGLPTRRWRDSPLLSREGPRPSPR